MAAVAYIDEILKKTNKSIHTHQHEVSQEVQTLMDGHM